MHYVFTKALCGYVTQKPHAMCASHFVRVWCGIYALYSYTFEIQFERASIVILNKYMSAPSKRALEKKQTNKNEALLLMLNLIKRQK